MKKEKIIIFIISGVIASALWLTIPVPTSKICTFFGHINDGCTDFLYDVTMIFYVFLFIPFFSLVTFFLKDVIFRIWAYFTYIAVPLIMVLVYSTHYQGGGFIGISVDKGLVAFFLSWLYAIISTLIILTRIVQAYWVERRKNQNSKA